MAALCNVDRALAAKVVKQHLFVAAETRADVPAHGCILPAPGHPHQCQSSPFPAPQRRISPVNPTYLDLPYLCVCQREREMQAAKE